jgi:hypothetical protein
MQRFVIDRIELCVSNPLLGKHLRRLGFVSERQKGSSQDRQIVEESTELEMEPNANLDWIHVVHRLSRIRCSCLKIFREDAPAIECDRRDQ